MVEVFSLTPAFDADDQTLGSPGVDSNDFSAPQSNRGEMSDESTAINAAVAMSSWRAKEPARSVSLDSTQHSSNERPVDPKSTALLSEALIASVQEEFEDIVGTSPSNLSVRNLYIPFQG